MPTPLVTGHEFAGEVVGVGSNVSDFHPAEGIYVIPFFFPVVPRGQARIRTQLSAAHSTEDVERLVAGFHAGRDAPD